MAKNRTARGYIIYKEVTQNPANILAGNVNEESFTVAGVQPDHWIQVMAPSLESGLLLGQAWCDVAGTVKVRIGNPTVNPINPASQVFYFMIR